MPFSEKDYKEIFVKISEAVREFLENIYSFNALEMGTREILNYFKKLKDIEHKEEVKEIITHIFKISDRVKFAKHIPTLQEKEICIKECENLLNLLTKKEDETL
jgi:predicted transcriptional regulator